MTRSAGLAALLAFGLALASCDGNSGSSRGFEPLAQGSGLSGSDSGPQGADPLQLASPADVAHQGVREFEAWDRQSVPPRQIRYREEIVTDGAGNFVIEPTEALTPVPAFWWVRQRGNQGFLFRYRDFSVRNLGKFLENYRVTASGSHELIAGRDGLHYLVERLAEDGSSFEVVVDVQTRLVLRYAEYDDKDLLVSAMKYDTFSDTPDLRQLWYEPQNNPIALDPDQDPEDQLGFPAAIPTMLPAGYDFLEGERVEGGGRVWLKLTYTDGLEPLFYLFTSPETQHGVALDPTPDDPGELSSSDALVSRTGPVTSVNGYVAGRTYVLVGKVSDIALLDMLNSALP